MAQSPAETITTLLVVADNLTLDKLGEMADNVFDRTKTNH